ncbi:MAG: hypothetical protein WCP52_04850 [Bacteroidota bacterium]
MATRGSNLEKNPFKRAMESSYSVAGQISQFVDDILDTNQGVDTRIADLYTYYKPINIGLNKAVIEHNASFNQRTAETTDIKTFEAGIPAEVKIWWKKLTDVYNEGTTKYNILWAGGNTSFYKSSRQTNIDRMNTLVTAIGADASLAALKTIVENYLTTYKALVKAQTSDKTSVQTGKSDIDIARDAATNGLWYVYSGLMMVYLPVVSKVIAYFPMELIYKANKMREYRLLVPMASSRKICIRRWKTGDKITMVNNREVDLEIGLTADSSVLPTTWYTLPANATANVIPADLGATTNKFVIVKNIDLTTTGDITFTLTEA